MRIVQVSALYPPDFNAGGTLACHHLACALAQRGHEVSVFAGFQGGNQLFTIRDYVHDGIPVRAINLSGLYGPVTQNYHNPLAATRFDLYLAERRPEVVHFHALQALGGDLLLVARRHRARVIVTAHDLWFACAQQFLTKPPPGLEMCPSVVNPSTCNCIPGYDFGVRRQFLDHAFSNADRILAVSEFMASLLRANGIPSNMLRVVENGLLPAARVARTPSHRLQFSFLGGPHPWKGLQTIAAAVRRVQGDFDVNLYGVGHAAWKSAGGAWPDRRIRCRQAFAPAQLATVMAESDVVLVPSLVPESFSLVTREALQHGVPVIASRCGGPESVIRDGINGALFLRGDDAALASAMQRFIEDSGWRMTTRSAAEKTPVRSLAQQTDEIEAVYKSIDREGTPDARPLPKNVLFVAGIEGAPFRYRVTHLMEQLALLGIETTARYCRDEESLSLAGEHEILVLYRVPWGAYTERIVARARSAGALVVFSVDDLIFEPSLGRVSALHGLSRQEVAAWFNGIRLYRATLNASDAFLGSTEALARMAANAGKPCFVHRNTLSFEQLRLSEKALATSARKKGEVRLAYLSGTRTHEKDFDTILEPLVHVMERRPETRLLLAGHLLDRPELRRFGKRIERVPFMTWQRLPELLARIDVNLAPLEIGSAFSDSKSELKYIEAAAVETATVAAGTEPFRRAIRHCETGMIASTPDEWYTALEQLVSDEQMRARIGKAAREDMYLRYTPRVAADALAETLRALAELRPRTALTPLPPVNDLELAQIRAEGIGIGHAALEPSGEEAGPGHLSWSEPTPRIFGEHRVRQRFVCPAGLHRIDVVVGTHCGIPRHPFRMLVREPTTGIELARCIEDGEQACDNAWMAFEFEPVRGAEGRTLEWVFDVPSASDEDGPSLWFDRQENGGGGFADRTDIILAFRTWARQTEQDAPQVINNDPLPDDPLPADQALAALIKRIDQERQRNGDLSRRVQRLEQRLSLLHSDLILGLRPLEKVRRMLVYRVARKLVRVLTRR